MSKPSREQLRCAACGWREVCDPPAMARRLRGLGMLKRQREPEPATMRELLGSSLARLKCPQCEAGGLHFEPAADDEWDDLRKCEACGKRIAPERLEVLPNATRCAACQSKGEAAGGESGEPEYCPRCGGLMQVRRRGGGGLAGYVLACTECGYK